MVLIANNQKKIFYITEGKSILIKSIHSRGKWYHSGHPEETRSTRIFLLTLCWSAFWVDIFSLCCCLELCSGCCKSPKVSGRVHPIDAECCPLRQPKGMTYIGNISTKDVQVSTSLRTFHIPKHEQPAKCPHTALKVLIKANYFLFLY